MSKALIFLALSSSILLCGAIPQTGGCVPGVSPDTTVADALQQAADLASQSQLLNQLTVGDVAQGFEQFAAQSAVSAVGDSPQPVVGRPAPVAAPEQRISDDQLNQVEALQAQLDAGAITIDDFEAQARQVIGDVAPGIAFGGAEFFGSPFGHHFGQRVAARLNLTDDQKTQARDIFNRLHDDVRVLREKAHQDILAVLTDDQRAQLDQIKSDFLNNAGDPAKAESSQRPNVRPGLAGPRGAGAPGLRLRNFFERLANRLNLSDDQRTQVGTILTNLRAAVQARHQQARDEFRAILTAEQLAILDSIEADHAAQQADAQTAGQDAGASQN